MRSCSAYSDFFAEIVWVNFLTSLLLIILTAWMHPRCCPIIYESKLNSPHKFYCDLTVPYSGSSECVSGFSAETCRHRLEDRRTHPTHEFAVWKKAQYNSKQTAPRTRQTNGVVTCQFLHVWCSGRVSSLQILTVWCFGELPNTQHCDVQRLPFILLLFHPLS